MSYFKYHSPNNESRHCATVFYIGQGILLRAK